MSACHPRTFALSCLTALVLSHHAFAADTAWPDRVVTIDQMKPTTPLKLQVPAPRAIDRSGTSTVVLRVLVDETGKVVRSTVDQSSGNANLDEALLHKMRETRFEPHLVDGNAVPVTVVAPMHVPFKERRR